MYWYENGKLARKIPVRVIDPKGSVEQSREVMGENLGPTPEMSSPVDDHVTGAMQNEPNWQSMALRLQAEMDNFRRIQARRADTAIAGERERLLHLMLSVVDNLGRALKHSDEGGSSLRQGVELTSHELVRLLQAEGVTELDTVGMPFNPELHEAVATQVDGTQAGIIIQEIDKGYRLGEKLLRPARVIVAA